jgi:hypothetical protein
MARRTRTRRSAGDWYNTRSRIYWYDQYALNEQETAFSNYDPDRIAADLEYTGADVITVYAANQYGIAYYPSAIWPQHPGLRGRDYVGDLTTRLRAKGKKIVLYTNWLDSKHPEWNIVRLGEQGPSDESPLASWAKPDAPDGRVLALAGGRWQTPCINSPKRDQVVAIARELAERYQPDGFHLDMFFDTGVCACDYCRPELEKICGTRYLTLEAIMAHWPEYINWKYKRSAEVLANIGQVLRPRGVIAAHNAFAPLFMPAILGFGEQWLPALDVFVSECFDVFGATASDLNATSVQVRWQHAIGKPSWILLTSAQVHYAHWALTPAQWQVYAAACKANGGKLFGPCGVGAYPDTTSSRALIDSVKGGLDFYMQDADLDDGAESAANIALVYSWATRKYEPGGSGAMQWAQEFMGWARLMIEEHLPFDIVVAENVRAPGDLAKYELVVLPGAVHLSDAECAAIAGYARGGGRVIATGLTSMGDDRGGRRPDFALSEVLGVSRSGETDGPFAISGHAEPEPAYGVAQHVRASGEALAQIVAVDGAGSVSGANDPLPLEPTHWPFITRNAYGKGEAFYVAFAIGRFYTMRGDYHIGARMAELLDAAQPRRQLKVAAPRTVEVTLWKQPDVPRTIIHLANRSVAHTLPTHERQFTEILPVRDVEITMIPPHPNPRVRARQARVKAQAQGDELVLRIPVLDAYAAIIIEPGRPG